MSEPGRDDPAKPAAQEPATPGAAQSPAQLQWRCRRGMKELDLLLEAYLRHRYPHAPREERRAFEQLLEQPDPDLAAWLLHGAPHPRGELAIVLMRFTAMAAVGLPGIAHSGER
jgi:antitoxin CptB